MKIRTGIMVTLAIVMVIFWSASALAWDKQEKYENNTGETAYDLYKILDGDYTITRAIDTHFASYEVFHIDIPELTVIRWYNGAVPPGHWAWACFDIEDDDREIKVLGAVWTDADGNSIGDAGPNLSQNADFDADGFDIFLTHNSQVFSGPASNPVVVDTLGTIAVTDVYWAYEDEVRVLEDLNEDLFTDPSITWHALSNISLDFENSHTYDVVNLPPPDAQVVLFRCYLECAGDSALDMFQYPVPEEKAIPTLNEWGLIILSLLLVASAAIIIRKKRRTV